MIAAGIVQIIAFAYLWTKRKEFIENTATPAPGHSQVFRDPVTGTEDRGSEAVLERFTELRKF